MYIDIVKVNGEAYGVKKQIHGNWFDKAIKHHGVKKLQKELGCDTILRSSNGVFILGEKIKEIEIIHEYHTKIKKTSTITES